MLNNVANMAGNLIDRAQSAPASPLQVSAVVRKLFMVLHGSYGTLFLSKFSTGEKDAQGHDKGIRAAMKVWDAKLSNFAPDVVEAAAGRMASEHPEYPPNLPQFEALCTAIQPRKTYAQEVGLPMLPAPAVAAPLVVDFSHKNDGKDWARSIVARANAGDKICPYTLQSARQALGMEGRLSWQ